MALKSVREGETFRNLIARCRFQRSDKGEDHFAFFLQFSNSKFQALFVDVVIVTQEKKNVDRRAVFRKFAKSLLERLPEPSAMLLAILKTAPRSCSANRYKRR